MVKGNVFVKLEEYQDTLNVIDLIKRKITEARKTLAEVNDLKNQEDAELELWKNKLDDVEKKIGFIDSSLAQPEEI